MTGRKPTTGGVIIGSSYDEARTRKMNAEAEIAELELARLRLTLCLTDDVVKAWEGVVHACKSRLLSLPTKIAPVLATETNIAVIKDRLEEVLREALAELANYRPDVDPVKAVAAAVEAEATLDTPEPKRRGRPRKTQALGQ